MIIRNYILDAADTGLIHVDADLGRLLSRDDVKTNELISSLLVWRHAFFKQNLVSAMSTPQWSIDIIEEMSSPKWGWMIENKDGTKSTDPTKILSQVRKAAGADALPSGNVAVTMSIREYVDRESQLGGLEWWSDGLNLLTTQTGFAATFIHAIIDVLHTAASVGSELFVEQVSILLSKDDKAPIASLVPTLHSDQYYGVRESAICSLLENGFNDLGGALFMPKTRMDRLWHMRPLDLTKVMLELPDEPLVATESGDVLIFDGMIGADGVCNTRNGVPHISPDVSGKSARLAILMYHRHNKGKANVGHR